jgi:hypothetical protein
LLLFIKEKKDKKTAFFLSIPFHKTSQIGLYRSVTKTRTRNYANLSGMPEMSDKKEKPVSAEDKQDQHCAEECMIGLDECAECGACDHCADGARLDEEELPPHWQKFIQKSGKTP